MKYIQQLIDLGLLIGTGTYYELTEKFIVKFYEIIDEVCEDPARYKHSTMERASIFETLTEFDDNWDINEKALATLFIENIMYQGDGRSIIQRIKYKSP